MNFVSFPSASAPLRWRKFAPGFWLPVFSYAVMLVAVFFTPARDMSPERDSLEWLAHYLGHGIHSVWVGISLLLLVVPSLWTRWRHHQPDVWAWRALDAILLDFLCVDALGKDLFTGLSRPNPHVDALHPLRAGFPSGHATMAFVMAWLIWQRFPKLGPWWFGMAALIAWSRVEVHAHYPYQVVAGALLGCTLGALILRRKEGVLVPRLFLSDRDLSARLAAPTR